MDDLMKKLEQIQAKSHKRKDLDRLFIKENTYAEQKSMAQDALGNPRVSKKNKEILRRHLDRGTFDRETLTIDPKMADKMDRDVEGNIQAEIRAGRLPKHDLSRDPQARRWLQKTGRGR